MGKKKHIDLDQLKRIPICEVAQKLGLLLTKIGPGKWAQKDPAERGAVTSLVLFEQTNTWVRFSQKESGGVWKGSTIDLCMHIKDCDFKEALSILSHL